MGDDIEVTSTTGVSAWNIKGSTIHRFSGLGIYKHLSDIGKIISDKSWKRVVNAIKHRDVIVIDEISMLSGTQFNLLDLIFRQATSRHKTPFGGKQIIFTGDFLQLPPVPDKSEGRSRNNRDWVFETKLWKDMQLHNVILTKVYRQSEPELEKALVSYKSR